MRREVSLISSINLAVSLTGWPILMTGTSLYKEVHVSDSRALGLQPPLQQKHLPSFGLFSICPWTLLQKCAGWDPRRMESHELRS